MICPRCQFGNPVGTAFCANCGEALATTQDANLSIPRSLDASGMHQTTTTGPVRTPSASTPMPVPVRGRRRRPFLFAVIVIVILGTGGAGLGLVLHAQHGHAHHNGSATVPPLPTPGAARSTYTSSQFNFTLQYPSQWHLDGSSSDAFVRVFMATDQDIPQAVALDVNCYANPDKLDARSWWQQNAPPQGGEQAVGPQTLGSDVPVFVATGQAQTAYTVYTSTSGASVCQIITYATDRYNTPIILAIVNSFTWK